MSQLIASIPVEVVLTFLLIVGGYVAMILLVWGLVSRAEIRLGEAFHDKLQLGLDELEKTLRDKIVQCKHDVRGELQVGLSRIEKELKDIDNRQRIMQSWIDRRANQEPGIGRD